jgi:hypothetical protein
MRFLGLGRDPIEELRREEMFQESRIAGLEDILKVGGRTRKPIDTSGKRRLKRAFLEDYGEAHGTGQEREVLVVYLNKLTYGEGMPRELAARVLGHWLRTSGEEDDDGISFDVGGF